MKIVEKRFSSEKLKDKSKKKSTVNQTGPGFLEMITQSGSTDEDIFVDFDIMEDRDFQNLAGLIDQAGQNLSQDPTPENFLKYKRYIKVFIKAVQSNIEVNERTSRFSLQRGTTLYRTFESIDSNLTDLAQRILSQEKERMNILKLVNNIKGLIVDLLM